MGGGASKSKKLKQEAGTEGLAGEGYAPAAVPPQPGAKNGPPPAAAADKRAVPKRAALKWKPPQMDDDIVQHASMLGLNVLNRDDEEYLWIAERAARDLVKPPWVRLLDEATHRTYYFHGVTKESLWTTPYLNQYKKLLRQRRQHKKQQEAATAAEAAAKEEAGMDEL